MKKLHKNLTLVISLTLIAYNFLFPFASSIKALSEFVGAQVSYSSNVHSQSATAVITITNNTAAQISSGLPVSIFLTNDGIQVASANTNLEAAIDIGSSSIVSLPITLPAPGNYITQVSVNGVTAVIDTPEFSVIGPVLQLDSDVVTQALLGENYSAKFSITNTGTSTANGLNLQLQLPNGINFNRVVLAPNSVLDPINPSSVNTADGVTTVIWDSFLDLAPNES
jgi:hypothetical protein